MKLLVLIIVFVTFLQGNLFDRSLKSKKAEEFYWEGFSLYHKGDFKSAEECFTKAIEMDPALHLAYVFKGLSQLCRGDKKGFIWIEKGKLMKPGDPRPYIAEGIGYCCLQEHQKALLSFEKADNLAKVNSKWKELQYEILICQSFAYYYSYNDDEALAHAMKAANLPNIDKESKAYALGVAGFICLEAGKPEEALNYLKEGERTSPNDAYIQALLGYTYFSHPILEGGSLINSFKALSSLRKARWLIKQTLETDANSTHYWLQLDKWVEYLIKRVKTFLGVYFGLFVVLVGCSFIVVILVKKKHSKTEKTYENKAEIP